MERPTIIVISDYGTGDPAFTEVAVQLKKLIPEADVLQQSVPPFSTLNTGYWIAQFALNNDLPNMFIYSNTAPRKEEREAQVNNKGEKLMYAKLKNGFEIIAVNAGNVFSFVKPHIEKFAFAKIANEGSQFRSRDIFPKAVQAMIRKDSTMFAEEASTDLIPDYPTDRIASIDGYGNLKLTTRRSQVNFTPGQKLIIEIHGVTHQATFTDGTFNIPEGQVAYAPGSTGHDDRFMEIFYRGQSACKLYLYPEIESKVSIRPSLANGE